MRAERWLLGFVLVAGCGALVAAAENTSDVVTRVYEITKADEVQPLHAQRQLKPYFDKLPADHKLRITEKRCLQYDRVYMASVVPVNAKGEPDGQEDLREPLMWQVLHSITYREGRKSGPERFYEYPEGGEPYVTREVPWKDDVIDGVLKTFHANGQVRSETTYVQGVAHGQTRGYDFGGKVTRSGTMKEGRREGDLIDYFPGTEQPRRVVPYVDGQVHGVVKEFYKNGTLKSEIPFDHDRMHGVERQFDADGKPVRTRCWWQGESASQEDYEKRAKGQTGKE